MPPTTTRTLLVVEGTTNFAVAFREVQRFWSNRVLVAVAALAATVGAGLAVAPPAWLGGETPSTWAYASFTVPLLVLFVSLKTEVARRGAVVVGFHPLRRGRRTIRAADITAAEAVRYDPVREFGGYGWRIGRHGSRAYNVAGNRGVRLQLADGRSVLIGSQRPDELAAAIRQSVRSG